MYTFSTRGNATSPHANDVASSLSNSPSLTPCVSLHSLPSPHHRSTVHRKRNAQEERAGRRRQHGSAHARTRTAYPHSRPRYAHTHAHTRKHERTRARVHTARTHTHERGACTHRLSPHTQTHSSSTRVNVSRVARCLSPPKLPTRNNFPSKVCPNVDECRVRTVPQTVSPTLFRRNARTHDIRPSHSCLRTADDSCRINVTAHPELAFLLLLLFSLLLLPDRGPLRGSFGRPFVSNNAAASAANRNQPPSRRPLGKYRIHCYVWTPVVLDLSIHSRFRFTV